MQHVDDGLLHAYLDGELETAATGDLAEVEAHLSRCALCRARLAEAQRLRTRARDVLRLDGARARPVPEFDALLARAADRPAAAPRRVIDHRRSLHRRGVALGWAASLLIALCAGWFASEFRFRLADPVEYGSREMQGLPAVTVAAPAAAPGPVAEAEVRPAPQAVRGELTPAEFYSLYATLPALEQFQRDAHAAAESVRAWERSNPELAQAFPAVHLLRWFHSEVERSRTRPATRG
jgi:anti-sigma factor RsiW